MFCLDSEYAINLFLSYVQTSICGSYPSVSFILPLTVNRGKEDPYFCASVRLAKRVIKMLV